MDVSPKRLASIGYWLGRPPKDVCCQILKPASVTSPQLPAVRSVQLNMLRKTIIILLHSCFLQHAMAACFWRNGTENTQVAYAPRVDNSSDPLSTVCCAAWDTLLPNGLCQNKDDGSIFRETCTKSNWEEGGCQELCSTEVQSSGVCIGH
jgi:hypothetical protein